MTNNNQSPSEINYSQILQQYTNCMEEIKRRTKAIQLILAGKRTTGFKYTDTEFICLQFRKILELIALANLVSNQEQYLKQHSNFANHYHAKRILEAIEKINPNFYPTPVKQIYNEAGEVNQIENIESGFLTKDEFIQIYNESSELMHAENPFAAPKDLEKIQGQFLNWLTKTIKLLNHHVIQLLDINTQIWVIMNGKADGKAHAYIFEDITDKYQVNE